MKFVAVFIGLFIAVSLQAKSSKTKSEKASTSTQAMPKQDKNSVLHEGAEFSAGLTFANFHYEEPDVMKDDTPLMGVVLNFDYQTSSAFRLGGDFEYLMGDNGTYDGSRGDDKVKGGMKNKIMTARARLGAAFPLGDSNMINPYSGVGYRYLDNTIEVEGGYRREITYLYLPLGAEWKMKASPSFTLGAAAEFDFLMSGSVRSHLSDVPGHNDISNSQAAGSGTGYRLTANFGWNLGAVGMNLSPYWHHWNVSDSDTNSEGYKEPKNETDMMGANFAVVF